MAQQGPNSRGKASFVVLAVLAGIAILTSSNSPSQQTAKQGAAIKPAAKDSAARSVPTHAGSPTDAQNPFELYLAEAKAHRTEPALVRFARTCGVDVGDVIPRFAERPRERWKVVKDLSGVLKNQETDFYHTLEVWQAGKRVVTEEWGMDADSGDYYRVFTCLLSRKIVSAELVSWNVPDEEGSREEPGWGYDVRWELRTGGKFTRAWTTFLDLREKPIPEPKLEADVKKDLDEQDFDMRTWADLEYPAALLK